MFSIELPPAPFLVNRDYPMARNIPGATTVSERLPTCLAEANDIPALYRFTIYADGLVDRFYVGETIHFASRMRQYCGMIRRLLLLYHLVPQVIIEKHPMRHIHYYLANSLMSANSQIDLEWMELNLILSKTERENEERIERQRFQIEHPNAHLIAGHANGNFETHPPNLMNENWAAVHGRLQACPQRRGRMPPFVV